jgi:hypothetical protein
MFRLPTISKREPEKKITSEFHAHGDPLLEAAVKYDNEVDARAKHKKELKEVYDKHARLVEQGRAGALVGDHSWFSNDIVPPSKSSFQK